MRLLIHFAAEDCQKAKTISSIGSRFSKDCCEIRWPISLKLNDFQEILPSQYIPTVGLTRSVQSFLYFLRIQEKV